MNEIEDRQQTLDQRRARHAWQAVERVIQDFPPNHQEEYARQAKKMPTRIMASGLGSSLSFVMAKAKRGTRDEKPHFVRLHNDLTDWVINARPMPSAKKRDSLLESVIDGDATFLRLATEECLAYLQWLNRFTESQGLGENVEEH